MDAVYSPTKDDLEDDEHIWISFASSDRNKIQKDDYIILKKLADLNSPGSEQIDEENKFKVLDVQGQAPDAIKYKYTPLGEIPNTGDGTAGDPGILNETQANLGIFQN